MNILGIIPARYGSSRLPGKALAMIGDKPMIIHVYERVLRAAMVDKVIVATDDERIHKVIQDAGLNSMMTSSDHNSGTERCSEVLSRLNEAVRYVINIQGDEPFIEPSEIDLLAELCDGKTEIATLVTRLRSPEDISNPNIVKAVRSNSGRALYFSRSAIPHVRGHELNIWGEQTAFWKHIGMYAYRSDVLMAISKLQPSPLEAAESLEQLRWLENDLNIMTAESHAESLGVDTPQDLEKARERWRREHL